MKNRELCERERAGIKKLEALKLPNYWKTIGLILFIATFVAVMSLNFFEEKHEILKIILKRLMLVSMLILAISKEKVEDEMIMKLRGQTFSLAFIWGVLYSFFQPVANYVVEYVIGGSSPKWSGLDEFQLLWFMLAVYLLLFHYFKRIS